MDLYEKAKTGQKPGFSFFGKRRYVGDVHSDILEL